MEQHQTAVHVHQLNIQFGSVAGRMASKIVWWPELCGGLSLEWQLLQFLAVVVLEL